MARKRKIKIMLNQPSTLSLPLVAHLPWNNKTPPDLRKSLTLSLAVLFSLKRDLICSKIWYVWLTVRKNPNCASHWWVIVIFLRVTLWGFWGITKEVSYQGLIRASLGGYQGDTLVGSHWKFNTGSGYGGEDIANLLFMFVLFYCHLFCNWACGSSPGRGKERSSRMSGIGKGSRVT